MRAHQAPWRSSAAVRTHSWLTNLLANSLLRFLLAGGGRGKGLASSASITRRGLPLSDLVSPSLKGGKSPSGTERGTCRCHEEFVDGDGQAGRGN
ncbi:hypothetical protein R1flu_020508 [Riccia fluitans]|uniref:Secreted protein n=1 Tax=Riccia fluitans TaxID=41844 RepID=A0ABD1ZLQ1_9MARC